MEYVPNFSGWKKLNEAAESIISDKIEHFDIKTLIHELRQVGLGLRLIKTESGEDKVQMYGVSPHLKISHEEKVNIKHQLRKRREELLKYLKAKADAVTAKAATKSATKAALKPPSAPTSDLVIKLENEFSEIQGHMHVEGSDNVIYYRFSAEFDDDPTIEWDNTLDLVNYYLIKVLTDAGYKYDIEYKEDADSQQLTGGTGTFITGQAWDNGSGPAGGPNFVALLVIGDEITQKEVQIWEVLDRYEDRKQRNEAGFQPQGVYEAAEARLKRPSALSESNKFFI